MTSSTVLVVLLFGLAILSASIADAQLSLNYYDHKCPGGVHAVANVVNAAVRSNKRMAAGLLRLHFHDCFVQGCDASVLLASTPGNTAERDAPPNFTLEGFQIIDQAKAALERTCPGVFSCSDILALAARDAIAAIGGPSWNVPLGRRDGLTSFASEASNNLPSEHFVHSTLLRVFNRQGFTEGEMVVLSGAHTIGVGHCNMVAPRLYSPSKSRSGPYSNSAYAASLKQQCPNDRTTASRMVLLDPTNGGQRFDVNYFSNVLNHKALFKSDDQLLVTSTGINKVRELSKSQVKFFAEFGAAMEKMGKIRVLTGSRGEIRRQCSKKN